MTPIQENNVDHWQHLAKGGLDMAGHDFILWTRTGWDWPRLGISHDEARLLQLRMLLRAGDRGVPAIGYHLDIWWGLKRQSQIDIEPFFEVDLLVTADGGHDADWAAGGFNHVWFPPGVSLGECEPGMYRSDLASPIAFVGNWQGDYHPESAHRHQLVKWLSETYGSTCAFWPRPGHHALRGADLRDLYASVDVLVGDSCFCGSSLKNYWSDRIPESLGRGGYLLHPAVVGMGEQGFVNGETLGTWSAGQWGQLARAIEWALDNPDERRSVAAAGKALVVKKHTYERRMEQLVELLYERKLLKRPAKAKP